MTAKACARCCRELDPLPTPKGVTPRRGCKGPVRRNLLQLWHTGIRMLGKEAHGE